MKNYYKILELEENSSSDEIKKSFRRLSLMYHPDRNKSLDAASRFQEINEAYEVLGNIENRNKYNRKINNERSNNIGNGLGNIHTMKMDNMNDIANIYNYMFNGLSKTDNVSTNLPIHIDFQSYQVCDNILKECMNNIFKHIKPFSSNEFTSFLNPSIESMSNIRKPINTIKIKHDLTLEQIYHGCSFQINYVRKIVSEVNNEETNEYMYKTITFEKGNDSSQAIILKNEGHCVYDTYGNVEIIINEIPHHTFKKNGVNLILEKSITLKEALVGFNFTFKHLNNKEYIIQNKEQIIFPNARREIPNLGFKNQATTGLLIVIFEVIFPENLTSEQKEKLKILL